MGSNETFQRPSGESSHAAELKAKLSEARVLNMTKVQQSKADHSIMGHTLRGMCNGSCGTGLSVWLPAFWASVYTSCSDCKRLEKSYGGELPNSSVPRLRQRQQPLWRPILGYGFGGHSGKHGPPDWFYKLLNSLHWMPSKVGQVVDSVPGSLAYPKLKKSELLKN